MLLAVAVGGSVATVSASVDKQAIKAAFEKAPGAEMPVSYTHLTLPTICSV